MSSVPMTVLVTYGAQKMFRKEGREGGQEGRNDIYFGEIIMLNLIVLKLRDANEFKTYIHTKTCMKMFTAVSFMIAKT